MARLRLEHLWVLLPAFLVTWMGFMHPIRRLDFWWHLKVGELIVTTLHIPRVDLFSFTHAGQPFVNQNWLGEVLYYLTYRVGGLELLVFLNTVLLICALLAILHLCFQATVWRRGAALCSLFAALVLGMYSNVRPQAYSFPLFALFYWILWQYREGRRDLLLLLPLLMVLWTNLHGAFILGPGLIAVVLGMETLRRMLHGQGAGVLADRALAKLALVLVLTVLAPILNPEGYGLYADVQKLQANPVVRQLVSEWQAPDIGQLNDVLMFFAPLFVASLSLYYGRKRLDATELGLFAVFAVLGLTALRNGAWFALIAAPIVARHLPEVNTADVFGPDSRGVGARSARFFSVWRTLQRRPQIQRAAAPSIRSWLNGVILLCLVCFTVLLSPWVRPHLTIRSLRPQLLETGTPVGAMDYIAEHALTGPIFHPQSYGDYLIWRLWPQQKSFIDGRTHLFSLEVVDDYILAQHGDQWEWRLAKYHIDYLLLPKHEAQWAVILQNARASVRWKPLYEDDLSALFERVVDEGQ